MMIKVLEPKNLNATGIENSKLQTKRSLLNGQPPQRAKSLNHITGGVQFLLYPNSEYRLAEGTQSVSIDNII